MTTIVERKSDRDVIFGFLAVVFALVTWRGWEGARGWSIAFGVLTVLTLLAWIWIRRQPLTEITITPHQITWGQPGTVASRIERTPATVLAFRSAGTYRNRTWRLCRVDTPDDTFISMSGFRPQEVGPACREHGWVFADDSRF